MSTVAELAARLQERIDRYNAALDANPDADRTEILSYETAALRRDLLVAALTDETGQIAELDGVDAWPLWLAAWAAEFRDNAFAIAGDDARSRNEGADAMRLFLVLDHVRPDQVPSHQRARIDIMSAAETVLDLPYRERELAEVFLADDQADLASVSIAVTLLRRSVEREAGDRVEQWNALMRALWRRYQLSSRIEDVTAAVDAAERSLSLVDGASRVIALRQIGVMEQERHDRTGEPLNLRRCLTALTEALDLTPAGDQERAGTLVSLGMALRTRGTRERSPEDLTRAVALTEQLSIPVDG